MTDEQRDALAAIINSAQEKIAAAGLDFAISTVGFLKKSDIEGASNKPDVKGNAALMEVCCDTWDCRSGTCKCIRWKNC
jgi:hypothetical protein